MESVSFKTKIICGKPNFSGGNICSKEVIEGAISRYNKIDYRVGMLGAPTQEIRTTDVSHRINELYLDENDTLCAIIELLDTPNGNLATTLGPLDVIVSATCSMDNENNVTLLNFTRFNLDMKR
jgi:hypothetical protein